MSRHRSLHLRRVGAPQGSGLRWTQNTNTLRRLTAAGYLLAAGTAAISLVTPDPDTSDHRGLLTLCVIEVAVAGLLWFGHKLPDAVIRGLCFSGAILFTTAAAAIARPSEVVLLFYLWPALQLGYFATVGELRFNGVLFCLCLGFAVHFGAFAVPGITYLATLNVMAVASGVIFALRRHTEGLVDNLEAAATQDDLTGLPNRRAFTNALRRELRHADATGAPLCLVLFDLDHFKRVNDEHGHASGDDALRRVADVLREVATEGDAVGRYGGEEFTLLLPGRDLREGTAIAQEAAALLQERTGPTPVPLSASGGVAAVGPGRRELEQLLAAADHALYAAKEAGRRRVFVAPDITPALRAAA